MYAVWRLLLIMFRIPLQDASPGTTKNLELKSLEQPCVLDFKATLIEHPFFTTPRRIDLLGIYLHLALH